MATVLTPGASATKNAAIETGQGVRTLHRPSLTGGVTSFSALTDKATANIPVDNTPLADALATKQAALVSGTNVKTVNGTSLLGAGDIVIAGGGVTSFSALTDKVTADIPGTNTATAAALAALQAQITAAAGGYAPVTLTTSITVSAATHGNRLLIYSGAGNIVLTVENDTTGGWLNDVSLNAIQLGAGTITFQAGVIAIAPVITPVTGKILTSEGVNRLVGILHSAANSWVPTEAAVLTASASSVGLLAQNSGFVKPFQSGSVSLESVGSKSSSGTLTSRSGANTSILTRTTRVGAVSATTTAGSISGFSGLGAYLYDVPQTFEMSWCAADALGTGSKTIVCISDSYVGAFVDASAYEPTFNTFKNIFGVAANSTATQYTLISNDSNSDGGLSEVINGGTGFPCNTNAADLYKLRLNYYPATMGGRRIEWVFTNLSTGVVASGTKVARLPLATVASGPQMYRGCAALTGVAPALDLVGIATGHYA